MPTSWIVFGSGSFTWDAGIQPVLSRHGRWTQFSARFVPVRRLWWHTHIYTHTCLLQLHGFLFVSTCLIVVLWWVGFVICTSCFSGMLQGTGAGTIWLTSMPSRWRRQRSRWLRPRRCTPAKPALKGKADWWEKGTSAAKQNIHMQIRSQACHARNKPSQIRPYPGDIRMPI